VKRSSYKRYVGLRRILPAKLNYGLRRDRRA
jgi:hypothetical protein